MVVLNKAIEEEVDSELAAVMVVEEEVMVVEEEAIIHTAQVVDLIIDYASIVIYQVTLQVHVQERMMRKLPWLWICHMNQK